MLIVITKTQISVFFGSMGIKVIFGINENNGKFNDNIIISIMCATTITLAHITPLRTTHLNKIIITDSDHVKSQRFLLKKTVYNIVNTLLSIYTLYKD